jgi:hypothetical protein
MLNLIKNIPASLWQEAQEGQLFYPGMVLLDSKHEYHIVGDVTADIDGAEFVYDAGCRCCSSGFGAYKHGLVRITHFAWLGIPQGMKDGHRAIWILKKLDNLSDNNEKSID